jgi:hypothetical protein
MANDVNCPMCGKANPAGSVSCKFCGARIVPMGTTPLPTPGSSNPTPEEDTEGWLRRLRGEPPAQASAQAPANPPAEQPPEPAAQEEEIPDWLARIRERSRADTPQPEGEPSPEGEASPSQPNEETPPPANANDD